MEFGGPEAFGARGAARTQAGPGEVRVRVHAATVNPTDTVLRSGGRADRLKDVPPPHVPGMDAAGVLEQIGEGVDTDLRVGERVMAIVVPLGQHGAYAERVVVPADSVVRSPPARQRRPGRDHSHERIDGASGPGRAGTRARTDRGRDGRRRGRSVATPCSWVRPRASRSLRMPRRRDEELVACTGRGRVVPRGDGFAARGASSRCPTGSTGSSTRRGHGRGRSCPRCVTGGG